MTTLKIILIGECGVGKTNIITRFTNGNFSPEANSTIGIEFFTKKLKINDKDVTAQIWDTAGQERFRAITKTVYNNAKAVIVVYDITNIDSYYKVESWIKESKSRLGENIPICLVGNKTDMDALRMVPKNKAAQFAKENNLLFFETSAANNENITVVFDYLIKKVIENSGESNNQNQIQIQNPKPKVIIPQIKKEEKNKELNKDKNKENKKEKLCKCS